MGICSSLPCRSGAPQFHKVDIIYHGILKPEEFVQVLPWPSLTVLVSLLLISLS